MSPNEYAPWILLFVYVGSVVALYARRSIHHHHH